MLPRSTIALLFFGMTAAAYSGIDLTPSVSEYVANGMKFQQVTFQDDKRRIEYEPPRDWSFEGGANQLRLKPKTNFAEAIIAAVPLSKPQPLDENAIKLLESELIAGLPVGSQFPKIEEEIINPVLLNGNASFEVTLSYQLIGEKFVRSVIFVNLRDTQLVFRLSARKDDFRALHREFKVSIFSWHWIEPDQASSEVPKNAQQASQ
jgi:hypothetical protein